MNGKTRTLLDKVRRVFGVRKREMYRTWNGTPRPKRAAFRRELQRILTELKLGGSQS